MSRQNLSRSDQRFIGRVVYGPYQGDKPGLEFANLYRWRPAGSRAITFTAALAAGATSATLTAGFTGPTGLFPITFSDGEVLLGLFANAGTGVTFFANTMPRTGGAYGASQLANAVTTAATVANLPPVVGAANSISLSQSINTGTPGLLNGATAGVLDVARNVVAAWTGTAIMTVTGTDLYGQPQTESSASGTSMTGKKAFATITAVNVSANVTLATVGTGNVLGLPFKVVTGGIFATIFNDAADAGTFVQADTTAVATATTGDVRGTYAPGGTLNGAKFVVALIKPHGDTTQVDAFGVTPA